jgi:hypothetical protein
MKGKGKEGDHMIRGAEENALQFAFIRTNQVFSNSI